MGYLTYIDNTDSSKQMNFKMYCIFLMNLGKFHFAYFKKITVKYLQKSQIMLGF